MFVKARQFSSPEKTVLLNINHILYVGGVVDNEVKVFANAAGRGDFDNVYNILIPDLLAIVSGTPCEPQMIEWLRENGWVDNVAQVLEPEPNTLGEICEVSFVFNRVVLTVNKGKIEASKKFGLLDNYERYEFDGGSMYFYCPGSISADFTISCGNGVCTSVSAAVQRCRKAVKAEMSKQCREKMIAIPNSIASDLSRNTNCSIDDFMVMKEKKNEN